ncbi:MAG: Mur ligase domain-containing protein [Candidatus Nomurabacteria bacterium]|jgi:UDP-N-acetylmuramate--alanine ligase|nr:Mur ligase domain-containing protein [Candidatus Nomurabacteria bacterium]
MHIYFSGIGGAGLGPLAEIAQDAGHEVSGSDLRESPFSRQLETRGVDVIYEQSTESIAAEHLTKPIDWLVHTSALADDHSELIFAREHGIRTSKRDEFLVEFLRQHGLKLLAVAGTHGKTTTTGMLIWAAKRLGLPISYSIGTTISFGASGKFDPKSKYFIYEADEYGRNFLQFQPFLAILPSVDYDHPDIFPTRDDYKQAFRDFLSQSDSAIMFDDTLRYLEPVSSNATAFDHRTTVQEIALAGQHNRDNAFLAAAALAGISDAKTPELYGILSDFPGTARRFEKLADGIYSDYAHHPTEISATLQMARELNKNVVAIYQPHQNERQHALADQYKTAFDGAKHVYWLPTYQPSGNREKTAEVLTPNDLIAKLAQPKIAEPAELNDELWESISIHHTAGDLIVLLSAGDADAWLRGKVE